MQKYAIFATALFAIVVQNLNAKAVLLTRTMLNYLLPFLAVLIGIAIALLFAKKKGYSNKLLLSFSGSFLLALTLFELLPEVYQNLEAKQTGLFIMVGILVQIILEFFSKGVEHGHSHGSENLRSFPWLLFISLCIHSFLEGFPITGQSSMVYGVLVHKIPVAVVIASFLLNSQCSKAAMFIFLSIFAITTPLGTFVASSFDSISGYVSYINAVVIGIFLHISTTILFESGKGHSFNLSKLISIILGIAIAYFI